MSGAIILDSSATGRLQTPDIPNDETLYVTFTRGDCMSPEAAVTIKVFDSVRIFVPNAFTPNGDGANDRWHLVVQGLTKKMQISVFDRWGKEVFVSADPNMYWDGTAGGHALSGTFVYLIAGTDFYNRPFLLKGTVMIIR
jgi:gliding motility-associated-like protein